MACKYSPFHGPDGKLYSQKYDVAKGSPLVLSFNFYMSHVEEKAFSNADITPTTYCRCVQGAALVCVLHSKVRHFLSSYSLTTNHLQMKSPCTVCNHPACMKFPFTGERHYYLLLLRLRAVLTHLARGHERNGEGQNTRFAASAEIIGVRIIKSERCVRFT